MYTSKFTCHSFHRKKNMEDELRKKVIELLQQKCEFELQSFVNDLNVLYCTIYVDSLAKHETKEVKEETTVMFVIENCGNEDVACKTISIEQAADEIVACLQTNYEYDSVCEYLFQDLDRDWKFKFELPVEFGPCESVADAFNLVKFPQQSQRDKIRETFYTQLVMSTTLAQCSWKKAKAWNEVLNTKASHKKMSMDKLTPSLVM